MTPFRTAQVSQKKPFKSKTRAHSGLASPPCHQYYKPASAHDKESYRVLEIYYKLPVVKIKLQSNLV
jgi:hypothetical protein